MWFFLYLTSDHERTWCSRHVLRGQPRMVHVDCVLDLYIYIYIIYDISHITNNAGFRLLATV